jgi:hypothetical protein
MRYLLLPLLSVLLIAPGFGQIVPGAPVYYSDLNDRFNSYLFRTYTDPQRFAWLLLDSAVDHWSGSPGAWDRSPQSYSYRVASGWGRRIVRNSAQFGFEAVLHEDSRYRPCACKNFGGRILYAVKSSVTAYHSDGSAGPAYGRIAAGVVASATSSTWHPQPMNASILLSGIGQSTLDRAGNNLLTEFTPDLKAFGIATWNRLRK